MSTSEPINYKNNFFFKKELDQQLHENLSQTSKIILRKPSKKTLQKSYRNIQKQFGLLETLQKPYQTHYQKKKLTKTM